MPETPETNEANEANEIDEPVKKPEPKKKKHTGLIVGIILGVFFIIFILPIILVFAFFFDGARVDASQIKEQEVSEVVENSLFNSFSNVKDTGKLDLHISQDDLNGVFKKAYSSIDETAKSFVEGFWVDINDNHYTFFIEVKLAFFKTKISFATSLIDEVNTTNPLEGRYLFKMDSVSLGRLSASPSMASTLDTTDTVSSLEDSLAEKGLHLKIDLANNQLVYKKSDLQKDVTAFMESNDILGAAITQFLADGLATVNTNSGKNISFITDISSLRTNELYVDPNNDINLDLASYAAKTSTALKKYTSLNSNRVEFMKYLIHGYDESSAETQNLVYNLDLSDIGISNVTAYKGANLAEATPLNDKVKNQINAVDIATNKIAEIKESDINAFLKSSSAIGTGTILTNANKDVVYVVVDNVNCNIVNNKLYITVGINVNGYETRVIILTDFVKMENYKLSLSIENVYFGTHEINAKLRSVIDSYLGTALGNGSIISYNGSTNLLEMDFSSAVEESGFKDVIEASGEPKAALVGASLTDPNAAISLTIANA